MPLVNIGSAGPIRNGAQISKWEKQQPYNIPVVAADVNTPVAVLYDIAMNGRGSDVVKVASNPAATPQLLEDIFKDKPTFEILKKLAANVNTPKYVINILQNPNAFIWGLAVSDIADKNPSR